MRKTAELSDHVALVAGASRPVGRAIADVFARNGASLVLPVHDDWPESTAEMEQRFDAAGYEYLCLPCDLTREDQVRALLERAAREYGALHYLINNIERGGMPVVHGPYELPVNRSQWDLEFDLTVKAKWNLYQSAIGLMRASAGGAVINLSSIAAEVGRSGPASILFSDGYSAANRAVTSFTRQWAREAAPSVRVNEIMLGLCTGRHGETTRGWSAMTHAQRSALVDQTLLKRTGSPEELAEMVYFVAVRATYMTGSTVVYDGGYLVGGADVQAMPPGMLDTP